MTDDCQDADESQLWRPTPLKPYVPVPQKLTISKSVLELTLKMFSVYTPRRLEACCFWYGIEDECRNGKVVAIAVPNQMNHWGCYNITGGAMAQISHAVRPRGWLNLAQVHIHPGMAVEHSRYDDAHANSRNALSIVFPYYGQWSGDWPLGIGVHEFQNDYWYKLSDAEAQRRVVIDPVVTETFFIDGRVRR